MTVIRIQLRMHHSEACCPWTLPHFMHDSVVHAVAVSTSGNDALKAL